MNLRQKLTTALMTAVACFLLIPTAAADQVILDDLIVDGSICAGFDCVNGESFGFDTIRLKENNLRVRFQDTSSSASFPSNDWQITANDSSNGGKNKFSIDDIDGGRTPFTVEAGAPSHSLYVEDGGRVGFGTSTPVVDLHVKSGNTPTLRLEQDGSSGFGTQTWDVAGNEANFFIRDATNGSTLPFRIFPGAPSNALTIEASGEIGLGTTSPAGSLRVANTAGAQDDFVVASDGRVGIGLATPAAFLHVMVDDVTAQEAVRFPGGTDAVSGNTHFPFSDGDNYIRGQTTIADTGGDIILGGGAGVINCLPSCTDGSSRAYKEKIVELTTEDALDAIKELVPVRFHFKQNPEEQVGFIAEDVPDLVATIGRKSLGPMDIAAVLTKVVQEQQQSIKEKSAQLADMAARLERLESLGQLELRLARVEALLGADQPNQRLAVALMEGIANND